MKLWKLVPSLIAIGLLSATAKAELVDFDISLTFNGGLSNSQQDVFLAAEAFWESQLIGYSSSLSFPAGLSITASGEYIDGVGEILGSAGPKSAYTNASNGIVYASTGNMKFDSSDLADMESRGTLYDVIRHEMAHVIGFGTLWTYNDLYTVGTGQYTGEYALAAYQDEFDSNATYVPIELDGGEGTEDGHWDETWAGPQSDIMTGYLEGDVTFSETSFASFRDLGYVVADITDNVVSEVSAPSIAIFGLSLCGLIGIRARRK